MSAFELYPLINDLGALVVSAITGTGMLACGVSGKALFFSPSSPKRANTDLCAVLAPLPFLDGGKAKLSAVIVGEEGCFCASIFVFALLFNM